MKHWKSLGAAVPGAGGGCCVPSPACRVPRVTAQGGGASGLGRLRAAENEIPRYFVLALGIAPPGAGHRAGILP